MNTNTINLVHLFLLSPLHTGGTTQEGNLLGIARESHTNLHYIPSSSIRGRLRSSVPNDEKITINGNEIADGEQLEQGAIWIGDGAILWIPIPSLSHGVIWISSPFLLQRWVRLQGGTTTHKTAIPQPFSTNLKDLNRIYLKDVILKSDDLKSWDEDHNDYIPCAEETILKDGREEPVKIFFECLQELSGNPDLSLENLKNLNHDEYIGLTGLALEIAHEFSFWVSAVYHYVSGVSDYDTAPCTICQHSSAIARSS